MEYAELSLIGHREDNQDRVSVAVSDHAALLVVVDGMGGHAQGALAAETALKSILDSFWQAAHPVFDPLGFLHLAIGKAHDRVVQLGAGLSCEARPRATCAICLVQQGSAFWAHVGDSRVYWIQNGKVVERTRDHSHVEQLLREGEITEAEVSGHPMRNFVECCLGGDLTLPEMTVNTRRALKPNDLLLLCTDGVWANLQDPDIAGFFVGPGAPPPVNGAIQDTLDNQDLRGMLKSLATYAVKIAAPYSDNTTAAALRFTEG